MRNLSAGIVFSLGSALLAAPALSMEPLGDDELAEVRGGFVSAGGFVFDFAVELQTYVDGTLVLASTLSLTSEGVERAVRGNPPPDAVPLTDADIAGIDLPDTPADGLVLKGDGGVTVLIQELSQSSIRNLVINTANDRHILQNTAISLILPNLLELQQLMSQERLRWSLDHALGSSLLDAISR